MVESTLRQRQRPFDVLEGILTDAVKTRGGFTPALVADFAKTGEAARTQAQRQQQQQQTPLQAVIVRRTTTPQVASEPRPIVPTTVAVGSPAYLAAADFARKLNAGSIEGWVNGRRA